MSTWTSLPSEIRKLIIEMGKEIRHQEFVKHKQLFQNCMIQLAFKFAEPNICLRLRILNIGGAVTIHLM